MGLFGKKTNTPRETVAYDDTLAYWLTGAEQLRPVLLQLAGTLDWPDKNVDSPVLAATLSMGRDAYNKEACVVVVSGKTVGHIARSNNALMLGLLAGRKTMPGAVILINNNGRLLARCAPQGATMKQPARNP